MSIKKLAIIGIGIVVLLALVGVLTIHFSLPADPYERACKLLQRGIFYARLGQHSRAIADYTAAIELEPEAYVPYKNRAISHAEQGGLAGC